MKKIMNYFVMGAAILGMSAALASCQKENNTAPETPQAPEVHVIHVELNAAISDTKSEYDSGDKKVTIENGDQLYVVLTQPDAAEWSDATGTLTYDGSSFKGNITYTGTYGGSDIITDAKDLTATFLPNGYDSVNYLSATGEATATNAFYAGAKDASVPQLVHLTATVSDKAGVAKTPLTLSAQNSVLCYSINANKLSAGAHTVSVSDGTTTISGSVTAVADAATTFAVAFPANATALTYTLSIAGYNDVAKSGKTLVAGKVVNIATDVEDATISGVFSVGPTTTVKFSKGNLQYTKSTSTWSFMENQYSTVETSNQNVGTDYASQDVVSLFGWGTSGWNNGNAFYQPYNTSNATSGTYTSSNGYGYGPTDGSTYTFSLTGSYANADWGASIGSGWRTLTSDEWTYLLNTRTGTRYCKATVNSVSGLVIFPDSYSHPTGVTAIASANTEGAAYTTNSWSGENWTKMETAGAVFLRAAGNRNGTSVSYAGSFGYYWSSTPNGTDNAYRLYFYSSGVSPARSSNRYRGSAVRLVQDQQ